jgi:DNA polymerase-1
MLIDPDWALRAIRSEPTVSFDSETTGLGPRDIVCGYVVANFDKSVYVPVRHEAGGNIPGVDEFEKELNDAFAERDRHGGLSVGHNLPFDLRMVAKHGVILNRQLEDTQINEGLINDMADGYGLDDCARRHGVTAKLGAELYVELATRFGGLPDRKQMGNFWRLEGDNPYVLDYATGDGITTIEVWKAQQAHLEEWRLKHSDGMSVHKLECSLIHHLARLNRRGLNIDKDYADRVMGELDEQIKQSKLILPAGMNVRSGKELEQAFKALGIDNFDKTSQGKASFTEKWLENHELGRAILTVRQLEKAGSSFVTPLIDTHNINGRVHPTLHQSKTDEYGAIGGRLSCSDPNLQAYPKRNKRMGKIVRPLIKADFGKMFEADFMQQEPHLFAHYSEDPTLIRGYTSEPPIDLHDMVAEMTGRPREDAKRLGMGLLTGLGKKSLAERLGWGLDETQVAINDFFDNFGKVRDFQRTAQDVGRERGWVKTLLGRIATIEREFAYKAVSRIIQGGGADHLKLMLLRAMEFDEANGDWFQMLMTIHDSFVGQFDPTNKAGVHEFVRLVEDCQTPPLNLLVPIPVEMAIGDNWGEASYGDKIRDPKKGGWIGEWR